MPLYRWIEVRPASSVDYEPGNFSSILEVLYNARKPFRFVAASVRTGLGKNIVRFYIQVEEGLADRLANLLRSWLGAQVLMDSKPPSIPCDYCVEYDLRGHYALPVVNLDAKPEVNNVDGIVAALASEGGMFEVTAVADIGAKRGIYDWIRKKTSGSAGFGDALLDHVYGAIGALLGGPSYKSGGAKQMDPVTKIRVDAASKKVNKSLFNCAVKAYGSVDLAKAVLEALPSSPMNRFTVSRARRGMAPPNEIIPPKKNVLRNFVNAISPLFTALIIVCALMMGLLTLRLTDLDMLIIALSIVPTALIKIFMPKKRPLILSTDELGMVVGLPSEIGRLPVETAISPPTREVISVGEGALIRMKKSIEMEAERERRTEGGEGPRASPAE